MTLRALMKLGPDGADDLRKKGVEGDRTAGRYYLLWTVWRRINATKGYSRRAKIKVMSAFYNELGVTWQTTISS